MLLISKQIVEFVKKHPSDRIVIEQYAFRKRSSTTTYLAELGGVVKSQLYLMKAAVPVEVVASTARKFLMGRIRGKRNSDKANGIVVPEVKEQVRMFLANRALQFKTLDIMDAFVVAYYHYCDINEFECGFQPAVDGELVKKKK